MTLLFGPIEFRCSHATSEVLFWVENEECFSWANFQDVILKVRIGTMNRMLVQGRVLSLRDVGSGCWFRC